MSVCPRCGRKNPDGQHFCGACGTKLSSADHPSAPAAHVRTAKPDNGGLIAAIFLVSALIILVGTIWILRIREHRTVEPDYVVFHGSLEVGTRWQGTMQISNYKGRYLFSGSTIYVEGVIGQESDGRIYFELSEINNPQQPVLMSFYVNLYQDHFSPSIRNDENSNWILDVTLDQNNVEPLTVYLQNGTLQFSYAYDIGSASCDLTVNISALTS